MVLLAQLVPATNPSPVDGAVDISLNPGDLTWVNGAGTT